MAFKPNDIYNLYDSPIPYKNLLLYPVHMRDYINFNVFASSLMLEKNSIPDVKVISMTYLEYMFSINNQENQLTLNFENLLRLTAKVIEQDRETKEFKVVNIETFKFGKNKEGKPVFSLNGILFNNDDFDKLRLLIAEQNMLDLPDERIQKDVRDKIKEARDYKNRINGNNPASLEEQIVALSAYTGWDLEKIYNLTVRKFIKLIRRINHMIYSQMYLQASLSGMVTFKDKSVLRGWLVDLDDEEENKDVTMDLEELESTIKPIGGK